MGYKRTAAPPARIGKAPAPIAPAQDCASPHRPPRAAIPASALPRFSLADLAVMPPSGTVQRAVEATRPSAGRVGASPANRTGLPDRLKSGIEALSGVSMDEVKVHYNSSSPARINALAFARGREIHLARGQEAHLPHEAWHLVQQARGRVRATGRVGALPVNDHPGLEREADAMGERALRVGGRPSATPARSSISAPAAVVAQRGGGHSKAEDARRRQRVAKGVENAADAAGRFAGHPAFGVPPRYALPAQIAFAGIQGGARGVGRAARGQEAQQMNAERVRAQQQAQQQARQQAMVQRLNEERVRAAEMARQAHLQQMAMASARALEMAKQARGR